MPTSPAITDVPREAQVMSSANDPADPGAFPQPPLPAQPLPEPPLSIDPTTSLTPDEQQWGTLCHFAGCLPLPPVIGPSLGAGVCWLVKKDTSPWVDAQGKKALNFHLTNLIFMAASLLLLPFMCIPFVGIIFGFLAGTLVAGVKVYGIITALIAGLTVKDGKPFEYPFSFKIIQ